MITDSMKVKRMKNAKKCLILFKNSFGFAQPFQILVDGTFCQAALQSRTQIQVTTPCVIAEAQALGPQLAGALFIAKTFKLHKCSHKDVAVPAANCIKSMIGKYDFSNRHCRLMFLSLCFIFFIKGVPILYIHRGTLLLEKPSAISNTVSSKVEKSLLEPSKHEKKILREFRDSTNQETKPQRKRKHPEDVKPRSVFKRKKRKTGQPKPSGDSSKKKRVRKRRSKPAKHVLEALQGTS
ncbi:PREDICTED: rRNA-processing protein UTP23 homolog [Acropora digitifera]|uniref:rRNA-processing protein UTP23 homolog n=1 Tax=Acropora digitifera TaxID=70779 RepID=UPI00077A4536|nr:PREDICTED: rRNA-processing protein UTP23 homolog [Acropora digitifera]